MTATNDDKLDPAAVAALYQEHAGELRRFLVGVLRDPQLAADAMQMALAKLIERGHEVQADSRKAWLFQVAYREALALRRREATGQRVLRKISWTAELQHAPSDESLVKDEELKAVQEAIQGLPPEQREVVRLRIYEEKTFAVIAAELKIPLGTALSRMRAALERLRKQL